jgi:hypothetical protein
MPQSRMSFDVSSQKERKCYKKIQNKYMVLDLLKKKWCYINVLMGGRARRMKNPRERERMSQTMCFRGMTLCVYISQKWGEV